MATADSPTLSGVDYFDGRSAQTHAVAIRLTDGRLYIAGSGIDRSVPAGAVQWPERTRHGQRVAHLADGGSLHAPDSAAWDDWIQGSGRSEPVVVRLQQSWRWVGMSTIAFCTLLALLWLWGVPWAARVAVTAIPTRVDTAIGQALLESLDQKMLRPTTLPEAKQTRIRTAFSQALQALPSHLVPDHRLVFRSSRIGPNALALPGGTLVLTDQLVELVQGDDAVIVGVLAHELGHVRQRHGMRMVVQATVVGAIAVLVIGDFSTLLAGVPVLLSQAGYSRDAEREADAESVLVLKAARISPAVMVRFFEAVAAWRDPDRATTATGDDRALGLGISIASHPADEERIRFFRQAAAAP